MTLESCGCHGIRILTWCSDCVASQDRTIKGLAGHVMEQRRQLGVMALVIVIFMFRERL